LFYGNLRDPADRAFLKDALRRLGGLFGRVHATDNLIALGRTFSLFDEPHYQDVLRRQARNTQEQSLGFRLNTLIWAAHQALHVPGDFVELGVWRGFCSAVVADYIGFQTVDRTFWLYDTFEGIPAAYDSEGHDSPALREPGLYEKVLERFADYGNVRVVRGVVPHSFRGQSPDAIAYLHIDLNSTRSEIEALEHLWDRVSPGGVVVFDDYGWWNYRAQHMAEQEWMKAHGIRILELPSGQGLVIKP
jgi:hypothetical protein